MFRILDESLELNRRLAGVVTLIARSDTNLASQIRRAGVSVALNLAEGNGRAGKDRIRFFRMARGSAMEVETGLRLAEIWGNAEPSALSGAQESADNLCRMTAGLVRT